MAYHEKAWNLGRLGGAFWAERPNWQSVRLEFDVYQDGITAGGQVGLLWVGAWVAWTWNHDNCPDCGGE